MLIKNYSQLNIFLGFPIVISGLLIKSYMSVYLNSN